MQQKQHAMFIAMVIGLCVAASFVVQAEDVLRVSVPHLPPYADLCQDKSAKGLLTRFVYGNREKNGRVAATARRAAAARYH